MATPELYYGISKPILAPNESVLCYDCHASSSKQDKGHVGVCGPFTGMRNYGPDEWPQVVLFVATHRGQPYCQVSAEIQIVQRHPTYTVYSSRYHQVFLRDDSLE